MHFERFENDCGEFVLIRDYDRHGHNCVVSGIFELNKSQT